VVTCNPGTVTVLDNTALIWHYTMLQGVVAAVFIQYLPRWL
jgi:hypothetical protein